jgi:hypothetical protein
MDYTCEQCGDHGALCVSDWGYIAALCDICLRDRKNYLKLPGGDAGKRPESAASAPASV